MSSVEPQAYRELEGEFGGRISRDPDRCQGMSRDASPVVGRAEAVVSPRDTREVQRLVEWARRHRIPLTPRGSGTSLDGESVPVQGGVVVDLSRMDRLRQIHVSDRLADVEPGVINADLQRAVNPLGLFYPPNPGSWEVSTIGGNVMTNASGFRSFRYGPTRNWVAELEGVWGTGETFHVGTLSRKRSAGPEIASLLVGSEGTLGIVTATTVRLAPLPERRIGLVVGVPASVSLQEVALGLQTEGPHGLSALEWIDAEVTRVWSSRTGLALPGEKGALFLELETTREGEEPALRRLGRCLEQLGLSADPRVFADSEELWRLRGRVGGWMDEHWGPRIREDVGIPLSRWEALLASCRQIAEEEGVGLALYAHLGEGNLHPNFLTDPSGPRAARIRERLYARVRELQGTISAEHGLGALKAPQFPFEQGRGSPRLFRALKEACDPDRILNPGKWPEAKVSEGPREPP